LLPKELLKKRKSIAALMTHTAAGLIVGYDFDTLKVFGADAAVTIEGGYPVLVNHEESTAIFEKISRSVIEEELVKANHPPLMGCEDFAYYAEQIPGMFWFLGIRPPEAIDYPRNHHAKFDFNDDALTIGIEMHCEIARRFASLWQP